MTFPKSVAEVRKLLAALVGFAGGVVADNLIHGTALRWTNAGIALGTAVLVYVLPNDDMPAK